METTYIIDLLLGLIMALAGAIMKYLFGRIKENTDKIDDLRVDLAKQGQENKELYSHIKRIDDTLNEMHRKLDEVYITMRNK